MEIAKKFIAAWNANKVIDRGITAANGVASSSNGGSSYNVTYLGKSNIRT